MATRMFELRDFGQRKRAVTLARGNINDLIAVYESIKVKTITNSEDAEELRLKLKTHQKSSLPMLRSNFSNKVRRKQTATRSQEGRPTREPGTGS